MCGTNVHLAHALILGPLIIAAAYFDARWLSYAVGATAIGAAVYLERDELERRLGGRGSALSFAQLPRATSGRGCMTGMCGGR